MTKMILALAGSMAIAAPASAVTQFVTDKPVVTTTSPAVASPNTPDELRAQAEALFSNPKQWKKAARLLEESAAMRSADDAEGFVCLSLAGRLRHAIGDHSAARQVLVRAAEHALARGAVMDAANAWIDAAHVAVAEKDVKGAEDFVERARLLSGSPLLTDAQRTSIVRRIG